MGVPAVMVEKLPRGDEIVHAFEGLQAYLGRTVRTVTSIEAGGLISTTPFIVAAALGLPLVDADGMGRAFPELQMVSPTLHGLAATPMAIGDEKGNSAILNTCDNVWTERIARTMTIQMGGVAFIALYATSGAQARASLVPGTVSLANQLGATIREARREKRSPIEAVLALTGGRRLFHGKIIDVQRRTERGFARGEATIRGLGADEGHELRIHFQNENLIALRDGAPVATMLDLITVLHEESGEPITTETLRYGFHAVVVGMPCAAAWRNEAGLALVGRRRRRISSARRSPPAVARNAGRGTAEVPRAGRRRRNVARDGPCRRTPASAGQPISRERGADRLSAHSVGAGHGRSAGDPDWRTGHHQNTPEKPTISPYAPTCGAARCRVYSSKLGRLTRRRAVTRDGPNPLIS